MTNRKPRKTLVRDLASQAGPQLLKNNNLLQSIIAKGETMTKKAKTTKKATKTSTTNKWEWKDTSQLCIEAAIQACNAIDEPTTIEAIKPAGIQTVVTIPRSDYFCEFLANGRYNKFQIVGDSIELIVPTKSSLEKERAYADALSTFLNLEFEKHEQYYRAEVTLRRTV